MDMAGDDPGCAELWPLWPDFRGHPRRLLEDVALLFVEYVEAASELSGASRLVVIVGYVGNVLAE